MNTNKISLALIVLLHFGLPLDALCQSNYAIYDAGGMHFHLKFRAISKPGTWLFDCANIYTPDRFGNFHGVTTQVAGGNVLGKYLRKSDSENIYCSKRIQKVWFRRAKGWKASISTDTMRVYVDNDTFTNVNFGERAFPESRPSYLNWLFIQESVITAASFYYLTIRGGDDIKFAYNKIDSIFMDLITLDGVFTLWDTLPRYIHLGWVEFSNSSSLFDLSHVMVGEHFRPCTLNLGDPADKFDHIRLNYEYFQLQFDENTKDWEKERIYKQLLSEQERDGFTSGYIKARKEYKAFSYLQEGIIGRLKNDFQKYWWDYGYDKARVIWNSIYLFLFFLLLNLFCYSSLTNVYYPENFRIYDQRLQWGALNQNRPGRFRRFFYRIPGVIVYSAYVFWGVKLDLKELEIRRPVAFVLLILEYLAGLVCIAYIANYLITR